MGQETVENNVLKYHNQYLENFTYNKKENTISMQKNSARFSCQENKSDTKKINVLLKKNKSNYTSTMYKCNYIDFIGESNDIIISLFKDDGSISITSIYHNRLSNNFTSTIKYSKGKLLSFAGFASNATSGVASIDEEGNLLNKGDYVSIQIPKRFKGKLYTQKLCEKISNVNMTSSIKFEEFIDYVKSSEYKKEEKKQFYQTYRDDYASRNKGLGLKLNSLTKTKVIDIMFEEEYSGLLEFLKIKKITSLEGALENKRRFGYLQNKCVRLFDIKLPPSFE
ncbi:MAG: hypothetical protein COA67_00345 [Lutibacter sp.]|nr:MAG: hypothetical protein COA67_00345 [Lutibacter sp.]